jgi:hypothetical membrane protein
MIVASSLYSDYSILRNYISDLGATCRGGLCIVFQPSSLIFNVSSILLRVFMITGSLYIRRDIRDHLFYRLLLITGIGAIGVGLFPENYGILHTISAFIAFTFGALASIAS